MYDIFDEDQLDNEGVCEIGLTPLPSLQNSGEKIEQRMRTLVRNFYFRPKKVKLRET